MKKIATSLPGVLLLEPRVFGDDRGFFLESYNQRTFAELGIPDTFVQDNHSYSEQECHARFALPDSAAARETGARDHGRDSRRRARPRAAVLPHSENGRRSRSPAKTSCMLWIPAGFAHGFRVAASANAHVLYKTTDFYAPEHERTIAWNDPALRIDWQLDGEPIVSPKDRAWGVIPAGRKVPVTQLATPDRGTLFSSVAPGLCSVQPELDRNRGFDLKRPAGRTVGFKLPLLYRIDRGFR